MSLEKKSFVLACKSFFGTKPGQSLQEFAQELKALTPQDRLDLVEMFKGEGIEISDPVKQA